VLPEVPVHAYISILMDHTPIILRVT